MINSNDLLFAGLFFRITLLLHVLSTLIGHRFVQLEVKENNLCAIKLYESLGFRVSARLVAFYSDGEDALVWQKSLASGD